MAGFLPVSAMFIATCTDDRNQSGALQWCAGLNYWGLVTRHLAQTPINIVPQVPTYLPTYLQST
jgi:hypothetical protein